MPAMGAFLGVWCISCRCWKPASCTDVSVVRDNRSVLMYVKCTHLPYYVDIILEFGDSVDCPMPVSKRRLVLKPTRHGVISTTSSADNRGILTYMCLVLCRPSHIARWVVIAPWLINVSVAQIWHRRVQVLSSLAKKYFLFWFCFSVSLIRISFSLFYTNVRSVYHSFSNSYHSPSI